MSTQDLVNYYANLLIQQYLGKPRAYAHMQALCTQGVLPQVSIQTITFSDVSTSGSFVLNYNGSTTSAINWDDSSSTIQTKLQSISKLSSITVSGSISSKLLTITFTNVDPVAVLLISQDNSLLNSSSKAITLTIEGIDSTLPISILNGFNVIGSSTAQGTQLDIIGKYAGVLRTGYVSGTGFVTLSDSDFLTLIKLAIVKNSLGSSLYEITNLLWNFFPNEIFVYDYQNMQMNYLVSTSVGSLILLRIVINQGLLPTPMGVQIATILYAPNIDNLFGFRTYTAQPSNIVGFNSYTNYQTNTGWVSYQNSIVT